MDIPKQTRPGTRWINRFLTLTSRFSASSPTPSALVFPQDFLVSLERLRLVALKAIGGGLREGHRLGSYKGGQLEFHGHRSYTPGDELRYVDWNTYARLGKPYIKEFTREEAGVLHLILDATPSMALGQPTKWTFARRIAALFSHVALASKDAVCVHIFRENGPLARFPLHGVKSGTREYMAFLENCEVSVSDNALRTPSQAPGRALDDAVSSFLRSRPIRGRSIIISDFWQPEQEIVSAISRLSSAGFDVSGIHVLAAEEMIPGAAGEILARSLEDIEELELSDMGDLDTKYAHEFELHRKSIEETFRKRGGNYLLELSETSIEKVLIKTLRQRRWVV